MASPSPRMIIVTLAALIVALLAFMAISGGLTGPVTLSKLWSVGGLLTIILVTAVVGLVVAGHQPRNPSGWLLAGEAVFILASVAAGAYADLVYRSGYRDLAFAGPSALVLSQLFSFSLAGFPLVILLFPDGRLPSRRWRWVVRAYVAVAAASVLAISIAILSLVIEHHVVLQASGNLESLGRGSTAWVGPVQLGFVLIVAVFWLAAIGPPGPQLATFGRGAPRAAEVAGQRRRRLRSVRHLGHHHQFGDLGSADSR